MVMNNTRNLKIEAAGDFWYGKVSPKIRLSGRTVEIHPATLRTSKNNKTPYYD
jgi:hypothetical protein